MKKENLQKITELRHELHRHPELSGHEKETIKRLRHFLEEYTDFDVIPRDGWFYGVKKGTDPNAGSIAFRADMDALPIAEDLQEAKKPDFSEHISENPGASHKCGHDGHSAALIGLALELSKIRTEKTVYLIFQPAEETGNGGQRCAQLLRQKGINEVYAFHNLGGFPEGTLVYRKGLTQPASEGVEFIFKGMPSHASAPENGLNPAEAIANTVLYAGNMRPITVTGVRVGNGDFGISPGEGSLRLTLRAEQEQEMKDMEDRLTVFAQAQADRFGLKLSKQTYDYFPETRNSDDGILHVLEAARQLSIPSIEMQELWRASEDFGWYLKECPGAMIYIGNGEDWPALHTPEYDFNDQILETAVDLFLQICVTQQRD